LRSVLDQARRGTLPGPVKTGVTFTEAADEWLRYVEHDRDRKPSTIVGYKAILRAQLLPAFGDEPIESITTEMVESWLAGFDRAPATRIKGPRPPQRHLQTGAKGLRAADQPGRRSRATAMRPSGDIDVFSLEEVMALVRAASSTQDAAIYLTAALTGLRRGELLSLRWRDVDFSNQVVRVRTSYADGALTTPKSGKVRSVPMAPDVAEALANLGQRENWTGDDDLVFVGQSGSYLDGRALRRRYDAALKRAGLRKLRFHDLRHTFGTRMIGKADIRRVQEWMGHADIQTTMKYLHYAPREGDAALVAEAFRSEEPTAQNHD
jgi:integrase